MRISIYIFVLFLSSAAFGQQDSLDKVMSADACACISQAHNFSEELFGNCFQSTFQKNNELLINKCMSLYNDTSEQIAHKFGLALYKIISVNMIYSCLPYYKLMDSLRYSPFEGLNKDSLKRAILFVNKTDPKTWDRDFLTQRGVMYFQVLELDNALKDFNNAIALDQSAFQSIYFKAWTLELKKNYDEAFLLYTNLAIITQKNDFNIFAAIAKRKKNGL